MKYRGIKLKGTYIHLKINGRWKQFRVKKLLREQVDQALYDYGFKIDTSILDDIMLHFFKIMAMESHLVYQMGYQVEPFDCRLGLPSMVQRHLHGMNDLSGIV